MIWTAVYRREITIELYGEHIYLREFKEEDWTAVHQYASDERVCRYQPWGPNTEEESRGFVCQNIHDASLKPRSRYCLAIIEKMGHRLIGAGEIHIRDLCFRNGEIGYSLHPSFWGKGFATEAALLLIDLGFNKLNLHRIYATCDPRNTASYMVMKKAGLTCEGRLRENLLIKDGWRDSLLYSILETDPRP